MKLNSASVNEALNQFSAQPIPANHPVVPRLANMFGDHTFFLDAEGLLIIEQADRKIRVRRRAKSSNSQAGATKSSVARTARAGSDRPRGQACSGRLRVVQLTSESDAPYHELGSGALRAPLIK